MFQSKVNSFGHNKFPVKIIILDFIIRQVKYPGENACVIKYWGYICGNQIKKQEKESNSHIKIFTLSLPFRLQLFSSDCKFTLNLFHFIKLKCPSA